MSEYPYLFQWDRHGRKGQPCKVTARGKLNARRLEFQDGFVMIAPGNSIRRRPDLDEHRQQERGGDPAMD